MSSQKTSRPDDVCDEAVPAQDQAVRDEAVPAQTDDPVFRQEQEHLSAVYATLLDMKAEILEQIDKTNAQAAEDKRIMSEELAPNLDTDDDSLETYADFSAANSIIKGYNYLHDAEVERLNSLNTLLRQPYFAKLVLQFKQGEEPKELYIGNVGMSDESYHRLVVDWRSPVAEVYYNQVNGPTSYVADGRTIKVDLKLRRQFDIEEDRLNAYFDTTVAIQDSLLLASLSKRRGSQMQAITATIQKEQNQVVRHADVPCLLVSGIAGSGKTSVLLQRIAYLYYQERDRLDADEVYLITPNPVFGHYIEGVLPDLGERNPRTITWNDFATALLEGRGCGTLDVPLENFQRIDEATSHFEFEPEDFSDISVSGTRLISANSIANLSKKYSNVPAGPHRVTLIREELTERLHSRLSQMAGTEEAQLGLYALTPNQQLQIFGEIIDPQDEEEEKDLTLRMLSVRFAPATMAIEHDDWLRIDRIGMRLLGKDGLMPLEWLYLKMALTGLSDPGVKHVMIDEVQDYTPAQLAVMARYFRRAHFLLLGDPNQAILQNTASFDEVRDIFTWACGSVEECRLMISYRSTPEITKLFASLLDDEERGSISAIQRAETKPRIVECPDEESYREELLRAVEEARCAESLSAVIVPWKHEARKLQELLGDAAPELMDDEGALPESGVVMITLKLAKGLEFDRVIIPDASARIFPEDELSRRRLYTTISRATREITILAKGELTPLLKKRL